MGKENHLLGFRLENFKRFRQLYVDDIGQFNLIVGDNNVGKTSLLEALLYDDDIRVFSDNLLSALNFKNIGGGYTEGHLSFFVNKHSILGSENGDVKLKFEFLTSLKRSSQTYDPDEYIDEGYFLFRNQGGMSKLKFHPQSGNELKFEAIGCVKDTSSLSESFTCPLIPFSMGYGKDLSDLYSRYIIRDRKAKRKLIKLLSNLIPDIEDIEFDTVISSYSVLVVAVKRQSSVVPLSNFGDGAIKLFRILLYLMLFKGKRVMIDEIDTGIHYSRMKDFWRVILLSASENDVQLFVTTHNEECIRYFKEVLQEKELAQQQQEARIITLVENPTTNDVESITAKFYELEHAVEMGNEVR